MRTPEQLAAIEAKLVEACEWAQRNGWRLVANNGYGRARENTCCAVGALAVQLGYSPDSAWHSVADEVGQPGAIGFGFDGKTPSPGSSADTFAFYAIGQRLRARFLTATP